MTAPAPWSVKGIDPRAREVAKDLARRSGMTLGEWLNRMIVEQGGEPQPFEPQPDPGRYARAEPHEPIPLEPSVRGLLGRLERQEREQVSVAARFEGLAEELRTDQMRMAERLRRMEQEAGGGSTEALHALEQAVSRLAGHVYDGEERTSKAIRDLGACFVTLDGRMRKVESAGGRAGAAVTGAMDQVRAELNTISDNVERKVTQADAVHAQALEKLGAEVARISERLAERITNSERRSAMSIDEVSEQVSRVAERIHQRQERAAEDVGERLRQSDERTAQLLEDMRAQIESSFAAAKSVGTAEPLWEAPAAEHVTFDQPGAPLPTTREVIEQARANAAGEPKLTKKDGFQLFPTRPAAKSSRGTSSKLQTALFVTGATAALGAGVASYMLGVAEPGSVSSEDGPRSEVTEPRVAVTTPAVPANSGAAVYDEAVRLLKAGDPAGLPQLRQAALLGHPPAQLHLARLYETGEGVAQDATEARRWTEQAARGGDGKAMHNLALYYFEGLGGPKDPATAAQWFRRAAEKGLPDSQYNLGRLYEDGYGVGRDPALAYRWYLAASRSGDSEARNSAERMRRTLSPQQRAAAEALAGETG